MVFLTIILFFIYTYGLGFSLTRFAKESDNFLERNLMRIGLGLGFLIVLGLVFNLAHIPLDWKIFLGLSLAGPLIYFLINIKNLANSFKLKFRVTKYDIAILIMLIVFCATFFMYAKGAFSYPWLEDDDSWNHAIGVKYVATEKTLFAEHVRYIDPYPPSYDMIMGILNQTNDSVYWTLKFFNALIISLSIIFFFFFAKELMGKNKALFATFALASVPAFLSHFIWSITLSVPMYFVAFYAVERIKHDRKWLFVSAVMIGAALTISPTHSTYFGMFFAIYYIIKVIAEKKFLVDYASAGIIGVLLSFLLWWLPSIIRHGIKGTLTGLGLSSNTSIVSISGTGDAQYNLQSFLIAQKVNMINNPIGIGLILSLLFIVALIALIAKYYQEINKYKYTILAIFLIASGLFLFFLSESYVNVQRRGFIQFERGTVPLSELLYNQEFFIISIVIMMFIFISLLVINFNNPDFKDKYLIIALAWLIFSFYAVNAGPFYYRLSAFRAWSIFVIPLSILSAEGLWFIIGLFNKFKIPASICVIIVIIGVILTSAYQKYTVNTAQWPPGAFWTSNDELSGYLWFKDKVPSNAKVFTFSNNALIIGFDKNICAWCTDVRDFQKKGVNQTPDEIYYWLKKNNYKYMVVDGQTVKKFGQNETNKMLIGLGTRFNLQSTFQNPGIIILRI